MENKFLNYLNSDCCPNPCCCYRNISTVVLYSFIRYISTRVNQDILNWVLQLIYTYKLVSFHYSCLRISRYFFLIFSTARLVCARFHTIQVNNARSNDWTHNYYVRKSTSQRNNSLEDCPRGRCNNNKDKNNCLNVNSVIMRRPHSMISEWNLLVY